MTLVSFVEIRDHFNLTENFNLFLLIFLDLKQTPRGRLCAIM